MDRRYQRQIKDFENGELVHQDLHQFVEAQFDQPYRRISIVNHTDLKDEDIGKAACCGLNLVGGI